jgi:hypothetical protein
VIAGLALGEILAVRSGFLPLVNVIPTFAMQIALTVMFLYSYLRADAAARP